jgi:hypothetical protein
MANVLSLALRVTADASRLNLSPVQRALVGLGDQADKLTGQFAKFAGESEAAATAQARFEKEAQDLVNTLRDGGAGAATQFAAGFERLTEAVNKEAAAFERAARITEANLLPLERFDRAQAELNEQLNAGRISLDTYNRATENAAKGLTDAERAARGLAVQQKEIDTAATSTTLKFNELSGVFSVLPGPLGNIAGRISGIASASEGLSRVFAGGLKTGLTSIASSVTALINPFTLALAGITAFAAGAVAVARGLVSLEDRVERLGRLANQLGVSFEFVQVLEEAGKRADVSIEQLSGSFARLQNTLAGADEESKKAQAALQRLGVSVTEFGALSEEQRIELIGERLAQIEDPAQRSAAAIALFGRSGVQLLPFFNELGLAATDMERFGRAVSDLDRSRLADFGGGIDALSLATQGLGQSLLLPFTGLGEGVARGLAEVTAGITAIVDPIGRILEPLLTQIGRIIELIGVNIGNFGRTIGAVFEPFAVIVQEVSQALEPLYEGIFNFLQGISNAAVSVTEWVVSFTPIGAIAANVGALGETISRVVTIITTAFQRAGEFVGGLVSRFSELVAQSPFLQTLGDIISSTFGAVASVFSTIANAIGGVVGRLLTIAENFLGIDRSAQQASEATQNLGSDIEELTEEERKAAGERDKFLQGFTANVSKAIDESAKFGQAGFDAALQYQNAITDLQDRLDRGLINEEVFRREAAAAEAAYDDQIAIAEQAAARIEENTRRVDGLLAKANEIPQIEQDLNAIDSEIARVEADLAAARESGATAQADALAGRLAQLDQLQAGLQDQADQAAQGFTQGFDDAFASVDQGFNDLSKKARTFGQDGFDASLRLKEGIEAAKEAVKDGILNREAFEAEVDRQKELFETRVEQLKEAEKIGADIAKRESDLLSKSFEIELARAQELANVRTGSVEIQDIRSGGISAFFDTLKEDPAIAEAKKQTKELEAMRREIAKLNAEKVDILAGTG